VEAPLEEAALVLALLIVPEEILEALMFVTPAPLPEILVNTTFVAEALVELTSVAVILVAVITLPAKEPFASRSTIVLAPLAEAAVVLALSIVPLEMLEALISVSEAPLPEMLAFIVPVTVTLLAKVAF
jgi:hypothetical protein